MKSAAASRSRVFYHPELNALRFAAFLMVFVAHTVYCVDIDWAHLTRPVYTAMFSAHGAGYYGVDLFSVLSSYLIAVSHRRLETPFLKLKERLP